MMQSSYLLVSLWVVATVTSGYSEHVPNKLSAALSADLLLDMARGTNRVRSHTTTQYVVLTPFRSMFVKLESNIPAKSYAPSQHLLSETKGRYNSKAANLGTNPAFTWWPGKRKGQKIVPHPLRMQKWRINMQVGWRRKPETLELEFTRDGRVISADGRTGYWRLDKFGILWELPMSGEDVKAASESAAVTLYFSAEVHWNVFGKAPKMFRGIVCRDRFPSSRLPPYLFRPVVATFHGIGIGEDTADISYSHRNG